MITNAITVKKDKNCKAQTDKMFDEIVMEKLAEAEKEAENPDTEWLSHDEVFGKMKEKYGYEV